MPNFDALISRLNAEYPDNNARGKAFEPICKWFLLLGEPVQDSDFVFRRVDGRTYLANKVADVFARIARKAGLSGVRLHDLRHTHASLMLAAGIHPKIVSERLGHSSVSITLDRYSHVLPGLQEAAALRFGEVLARSDETPVTQRRLIRFVPRIEQL